MRLAPRRECYGKRLAPVNDGSLSRSKRMRRYLERLDAGLDAAMPTWVLRRTETTPAAASENVSSLKQYIVFRLDRFEIGLFAEHDPHLDLDSPRDKRDRDIVSAPFERI